MFISKLSRFFNPIPRAVNDANPRFLDILQIVFSHKLFTKSTEHNSFELFLLVFDSGQQFKSLHLFPCAFFTIAMPEIHHEKRHFLLGLHYLLPFALWYLLFLIENLLLLGAKVQLLQVLLEVLLRLVFLHWIGYIIKGAKCLRSSRMFEDILSVNKWGTTSSLHVRSLLGAVNFFWKSGCEDIWFVQS